MNGLWLFILFVPFIASLLGDSGMAKMLCLLCSVFAVLKSGDASGAALPWIMGMLIAGASLWERFRKIGMVGP